MKTQSPASCGIVILAAGQGKRMRSSLPKVLHAIGGQPLLFHILDRIQEAVPNASIALVVGHGRELVEKAVREHAAFRTLDIQFVLQAEQKGTGHAARCAMDSEWGTHIGKTRAPILVLPGDIPLLTSLSIKQMLQPLGRSSALRILTCDVPNATGYGRIIRRGNNGPILRIVEERDANPREREVREINTSIYLFHAAFLRGGLHRLSDKNAQGEYYLTDLLGQAVRAKKPVEVFRAPEHEEFRGVNDPWELSQAGQALNRRLLEKWGRAGVHFECTRSTWVDVAVGFAESAHVGPGVVLRGKTQIGKDVILGPHVVLESVLVGAGAEIKTGTTAEHSIVGPGVKLGPYAHLRPESEVGRNAKIGNFVELKKTKVGAETSISHLSYLGDAEVGERVNIGCGFVTCNFDGRVINGSRKHKTIIEDDAFVGSDCQAVAPLRIGKGAFVASGSTLTQDVEAGALAIARTRQVNKPGYAKKLKEK